MPGNVFYNGYWAIRELLEAIERAGTTNNIAVIKELEKLKIPAADRMQQHDAWINAEDAPGAADDLPRDRQHRGA